MKCESCKSPNPIWRAVKVVSVTRDNRNLAVLRVVVAQCSTCSERYVFRSVPKDGKWVFERQARVKYRNILIRSMEPDRRIV